MRRWITSYRLLWVAWLLFTFGFSQLIEPDDHWKRVAIVVFGWAGVGVGAFMSDIRYRPLREAAERLVAKLDR